MTTCSRGSERRSRPSTTSSGWRVTRNSRTRSARRKRSRRRRPKNLRPKPKAKLNLLREKRADESPHPRLRRDLPGERGGVYFQLEIGRDLPGERGGVYFRLEIGRYLPGERGG